MLFLYRGPVNFPFVVLPFLNTLPCLFGTVHNTCKILFAELKLTFIFYESQQILSLICLKMFAISYQMSLIFLININYSLQPVFSPWIIYRYLIFYEKHTQEYNKSLNKPSFAQQLRKKPTSIEVFQCKNLSYHHHSSHWNHLKDLRHHHLHHPLHQVHHLLAIKIG